VIDCGSGSGILAVAAALLGTSRRALVVGDTGALGRLIGPADMVVSNILRTVNIQILSVIRRTLVDGGVAVFSGMEEAEPTLFLPSLAGATFEVLDRTRDAGWWAVAARPC